MIKKNGFVLWVVIFIFLSTYNINFNQSSLNSFFKIKKIEIIGVKNSNNKKINERFNSLKGQNLIFINKKELAKIGNDFKFINELKIKKIYPDKINIIINESKIIGVYFNKQTNNKYILTGDGKVISNFDQKNFKEIPLVYGENAEKYFYIFHPSIISTGLDEEMIKHYKFFPINRWDIVLKNDKTIKLPVKNYEESIKNFISIYQKDSFKNFKLFDFRVSKQLVVK